MEKIKPPAVAGSFYPADVDELVRVLDGCFISHPLGPLGAKSPLPGLIAGMVPHAGYIYSGPCAAHFYSCLDADIRRVVLLGVNHRSRGSRAALSPWDSWRTPLGDVQVNRELTEMLASRVPWLIYDSAGHESEHSIEVQLPFLQRTVEEFTFVPISLSHLSSEECLELGIAIFNLLQATPGKSLVIASSDLSHYFSPEQTEKLDRLALDQILNLNSEKLIGVVAQNSITMCGVLPAAVMLNTANAAGANRARLLKHCHSGDVTPMREVVGYASVAIANTCGIAKSSIDLPNSLC